MKNKIEICKSKMNFYKQEKVKNIKREITEMKDIIKENKLIYKKINEINSNKNKSFPQTVQIFLNYTDIISNLKTNNFENDFLNIKENRLLHAYRNDNIVYFKMPITKESYNRDIFLIRLIIFNLKNIALQSDLGKIRLNPSFNVYLNQFEEYLSENMFSILNKSHTAGFKFNFNIEEIEILNEETLNFLKNVSDFKIK